MSTLTDAGHPQRPKKKLAAYGKATPKPRPQHAASPSVFNAKAVSEPVTPTAALAPVKDVYDYDFVDEAPPAAAKPAARLPKPLSGARTTAKPAPMSTSSVVATSLPVVKPASSTQRSTIRGAGAAGATGGTAGGARGVKRKPSQITSTSGRPAASAGFSANKHAAPAPASKRQTPSSSPDPIASSSPSSSPYKPARTARAVGTMSAPAPSSPAGASLSQRALKTPPRTLSSIASPLGGRLPSASPGKVRPAAVGPSTSVKNGQKTPRAPAPHQMPFRPLDDYAKDHPSAQKHAAAEKTPRARPPLAAQRSAPAQAQAQQPQPVQRKRRRLIDTLAAQREEQSSSDEDERPRGDVGGVGDDDEDSSQADTDTILSRRRFVRSTPVSEDRGTYMDLESLVTASPGKASVPPSTPATITRTLTARRPGVKFTYNLERTMLAEEPVILGGPQGSDLALLESLLPEPEPKANNAFDFDDDMGGSSQGAIQSIHELRQAGANSRFADELVDIMDRVGVPSTGKPSSARRSALLEMAQKLQEKSFLRHFRDQNAELQLFRNAGRESDVVAGFTLSCIVITLLANGSASHRLLRELRQQKIGDLFATLLDNDADVVALARDRKNNVSNHVRQLLANLKETMRTLAIWKPAPAAPSQLSPRTVSLKALHMFAQQLQSTSGGLGGFDEDDGVLSVPLTKQLFGIFAAASPSADADADADADANNDDDVDRERTSSPALPLLSLRLSDDADAVDVHLALSLLEMHSVAAMQSDIGAEWTRDYIPGIADALGRLLAHQPRGGRRCLTESELLVLKLALNTANNNPDAARCYVDKGLLLQLAELSAVALAAVVRSVKTGEAFASDTLHELLLMLGVMINFSENDPAAAETLVQGGGSAVFNQLGRSFLDGRSIAAEADSEETSQLSVAFAYLSILLGYLCLHDPLDQAFCKLSPSRNLSPLLESIRQFIVVHDQLGKGSDTDHHFTARLRALAHELEVRA
ncbi:Wings apart-like protein [Niveomyces insectorum RCEF 264]|uniref:Wings apart-like protein n=1 Tax=Niveomyces insectorum RCEF 264 TaxID=1081102 RepID=A0A167PT05_9HYPO|nr:Wings apart-like protein [Niveomyces insectorum RCEF 264]